MRRRRVRAGLSAVRAWDRAAPIWEEFVETGRDRSRNRVHGPALLRAVGPVAGLRLLDLGCGQGWYARRLARAGASVVGVDASRAMVELAERHEAAHPLGIEYVRGDARRLAAVLGRRRFDRIVAGMSLMDMPDLPRVLGEVRDHLRPSGLLVFSITHPLNTARRSEWSSAAPGRHGPRILDGYFDARRDVFEWNHDRLRAPFTTPFWHRTLEGWFHALRTAGFVAVEFHEPRPTARDVAAVPGLDGPRRVPFWAVFVCRPLPPA